MIGALQRAWHRHVRGHYLVLHPALRPDKVIRDGAGAPLINVYQQDTFARPDPHWECNCGQTWGVRQ